MRDKYVLFYNPIRNVFSVVCEPFFKPTSVGILYYLLVEFFTNAMWETILAVTSMLETNRPSDRFNKEKSRQHNDSVTNILNQSPS